MIASYFIDLILVYFFGCVFGYWCGYKSMSRHAIKVIKNNFEEMKEKFYLIEKEKVEEVLIKVEFNNDKQTSA